MKTSQTLIAAALLAVAGSSFAADDRWNGGRHGDLLQTPQEQRQEQQIRDGLRRGELTRQEARLLQRQQTRIDAFERRYLADGRLDRHERQHLQQLRREAARDIQRELHDRETRVARHDGAHDGRWAY
jgi:hypothetical protein